jgi:HAD superfamily phosphatase (TIGR01668 family)
MKVDENEIVPSEKVVELFQELSNDFKLFIASNNKKERVRRICKYMNVHAFYSVVKPTKKIKKLLLKKYDVQMNEVAMVGDQLVTDIFMGNRLKMYTVLVDPMTDKDLKVTYFNRWLEKMIMKRIKLKRGEYYEEIL